MMIITTTTPTPCCSILVIILLPILFSFPVRVDMTPPTTGYVYDGLELDDDGKDVMFSSKAATVEAHWTDFEDPESSLTAVQLLLITNGNEDDIEVGYIFMFIYLFIL